MIGVDLAFTTGQVGPPDRLAAWRELVNRVFLPLAITPIGGPDRAGAFGGSVTGRSVGEGVRVQVWRVKASPMSAVRSWRHVETSGNGDYLLALHITGTAHATQDGREVTLGPGDLALFDPSRPYTISFPGPGVFQHVIYQVPRASVRRYGETSRPAVLAAGTRSAVAAPISRRASRLARGTW